jgi:hypothetical protein
MEICWLLHARTNWRWGRRRFEHRDRAGRLSGEPARDARDGGMGLVARAMQWCLMACARVVRGRPWGASDSAGRGARGAGHWASEAWRRQLASERSGLGLGPKSGRGGWPDEASGGGHLRARSSAAVGKRAEAGAVASGGARVGGSWALTQR